jgi:hypothetical protein
MWVPCHHVMVRPQVVDGGDVLQVWKEAANILHRQSQTADQGWSSSLGVGRGAHNSSPLQISLLRKFTRSIGPWVIIILSGVRLSQLGTSATVWPIVPAPDDRWWWLWNNWWNEDWQGNPKFSEKTCSTAISSTTNPTWPDQGSDVGRRGGKLTTNRLSYGTTCISPLSPVSVFSQMSDRRGTHVQNMLKDCYKIQKNW